jgi:hypothetical protein
MTFASLSVPVVLAGLAGGAFGAAVGARQALALAGALVVVGELSGVGPGPAGSLAGTPALEIEGLGGTLGVGPLLGPHVAFAGGVAAAAYLGRSRMFDTGFRYHQAKSIGKPLGSQPKPLAVGAVFGGGGAVLAQLIIAVGLPLDPVALTVVLSAVVHRVALGYPLVGPVRDGLLDMSPFERQERWEGDRGRKHGRRGRLVVEPWLPEHYAWDRVAALGAVVGAAGGYLARVSNSVFLAFGLTAASLVVLSAGRFSFPVTHHMALPAGIAAVAVDAGPAVAIAVGAGFGVVAGLVGELGERALYAHGDTHFDPPMVAILTTSLLLTGLAAAGVLEPDPIPYPGV